MLKVYLQDQSWPICFAKPLNSYQKGTLYCVEYERDGEHKVQKFPLEHIFRIEEPYESVDNS